MNKPFYTFKSSKGDKIINILLISDYDEKSITMNNGKVFYTDDTDDDSNTDGLTTFINDYYTP